MLTAVPPDTAMLRRMWVFPLAAALVAVLFAAALVRRYAGSRRPYELVWALALLMYAGASLAVSFGVAYASIAWLLRFVARHSFTSFVVYRTIIGLLLFALLGAGTLNA